MMNQGFTKASNVGGPNQNPPPPGPNRGVVNFDQSAPKRRKLNDGINTLSLKRLDAIKDVTMEFTFKEDILCVLASAPLEPRQSEYGTRQYGQTIHIADETRQSIEIRLWAFPERAHLELLPTHLPVGTPIKLHGLKLEPHQRPTVRIGKDWSVKWYPNGVIPSQELPIIKARIAELNEWWAETAAPLVAKSHHSLAELVEMDKYTLDMTQPTVVCQWIGVEPGPPTEKNKRLVVCDGSHRPNDTQEYNCTIRIYPELVHLFPEENLGRWMRLGPVVLGTNTPLSCVGHMSPRKFSVALLNDTDPEVLERLAARAKLLPPKPQPVAHSGPEYNTSGPFVYAGASAAPHHPAGPFPVPQIAESNPAAMPTSAAARASSDPEMRSANPKQTHPLSRSASESELHLRGRAQPPPQPHPDEFSDPKSRVVTKMHPKYSTLPFTEINKIWAIMNNAHPLAGPVYRTKCKVLAITPKDPKQACRQLCRTCKIFLPADQVHRECHKCRGARLDWWFYVFLSVCGKALGDFANVLITGPAAEQFFDVKTPCNLNTADPALVRRITEKLEVLSDKHSLLDIGVEIDEQIKKPEDGVAFPKLILSSCVIDDSANGHSAPPL